MEMMTRKEKSRAAGAAREGNLWNFGQLKGQTGVGIGDD